MAGIPARGAAESGLATRPALIPPATHLAVGTAAAAVIAVAAAVNGAYFPTAWGWAALGFGWTAALTLILRGRAGLARLELVGLGALWALTVWIALSAAWSESVTRTMLDVERALVYATALTALLLLVRRRGAPVLVAGVLAAIVVVSTYSLATRLFPEQLAEYDSQAINRLQQPMGYWNALGAFAGMGIVLALGFAARARPIALRGVAAFTLPLLATTFYFTFGRGAWIALAVALAAFVALDARRLQLVTTMLVVAAGPAVAVWLASGEDALTSRELVLEEASRQGADLVPVVLGLSAATAAAAVVLALVERLVPPWRRARLAYGAVVWAVGIGIATTILARYGAPWDIADRAYHEFITRPSAAATPAPAPAPAQAADLNERLFSFWGNGRAEAWRVAWNDVQSEPILGTGAGTFDLSWNRERPFPSVIQDAHSLYVEVLAELGPVGLGLLLVTLGIPLIAAARARRRPLVTAAFGAYVLYLVHAAADWDWELTALTLTALFLAAALFASARERPARPLTPPLRIGALVLTLVAVGFAFVALVSNTALSESHGALKDQDYARAEKQARKATDWAPWSAQGWEALGDAQLEQGKVAAAKRSYRTAVAKDRRDSILWLKLAFASSGSARRQAALVAYKLNPLSPELEQAHLGIPADG